MENMERSVECPITEVEHLIVRPEDQENIQRLRIWATSIYIRMKRNQKVILSVDCEGWKLGNIRNSLRLLQVCEILDESFFDDSVQTQGIQTVGIKPGFLIHFPTTKDVVELISGIFTHPNVLLVTYDFTGDVSSLMEAGVYVNMNCLFDAQLTSDCQNPLTSTSVQSILVPAYETVDQIVESKKTYEFMQKKKYNMFDIMTFLHRNDPDPFQAMFEDGDFYLYAAADLVMTGIAALSVKKKGIINRTVELSHIKAQKFLEFQNGLRKYPQVLMPSAMRQLEFVKKYNLQSLKDYLRFPLSKLTTDDQINRALSLYGSADMVLNLKKILPPEETASFDAINVENIKKQLESILKPVTEKIKLINPIDRLDDECSNGQNM